jgi:hypothetical protein
MKRLVLLTFVVLFGVFSGEAQIFSRFSIFQQAIAPLYRKPSKKELKLVEPGEDLRGKYAEFLRQPDTGLTKLINDKGCAENTKVVVATDDCLKYTMPGAGSSYSFRTETYRIPRLSDITFTDNSFQATGILLHGIFVNIGDIPLEKVSLQTAGMKFLTDFQPEPDFDKAKNVDAQLSVGIKKDNFIYRRALYAVENSTFALRSIAYGGKSFRAVRGVTYDEFDFDKRRDAIVIFRIVQKDKEGNITILWKLIQQKDSPTIKRNNPKK